MSDTRPPEMFFSDRSIWISRAGRRALGNPGHVHVTYDRGARRITLLRTFDTNAPRINVTGNLQNALWLCEQVHFDCYGNVKREDRRFGLRVVDGIGYVDANPSGLSGIGRSPYQPQPRHLPLSPLQAWLNQRAPSNGRQSA